MLQLTQELQNLSLLEDPTQEKIDLITSELTKILVEPAKQVGLCKKYSKNNKRKRNSPSKPWFNESCEKSRKNYFKEKNSIWSSKTASEKISVWLK